MFKIKLINMPFAEVSLPSIGLTQIQTVLREKYNDNIEVEILYLNHDFTQFLGMRNYRGIVNDTDRKKIIAETEFADNGLGDWFFRGVAFPELEDNTEAYFGRYYPRNTDTKELLIERRQHLDNYLDEMIDKYNILDADMLAFTSMVQQQVANIAMIKKIKSRKKDIITSMGGVNCEYPAGLITVKNIEEVDYVFSGLGLISVPSLVGCLLNNDLEGASRINGVYSKANLQALLKLEEGDPRLYGDERDINEVVKLDYTSFLDSIEEKCEGFNPILTFETSRGCWWGEKSVCAFCTLNRLNTMQRKMDPDKAIDYLESIFKYADRCDFFIGVDSVIPLNYFKEVFTKVKVPDDIHIYYGSRVNFTEEQLRIMADKNINMVLVGIESLCTDNLKIMRKGATMFDNIRFLMNCRKHGIVALWNFLMAVPGEDIEVYSRYQKLIPIMQHLMPPSAVWPVTIQKHSLYSKRREEYGLELVPDIELLQYLYPYDEEDLQKIAYYYDVVNKEDLYSPLKIKRIIKTQELIAEWKKAWQQGEDKIVPNLYLEQKYEKYYIYDSRNNSEIWHEIDVCQKELLNLLGKEKNLEQIKDAMPSYTGTEIEEKVNSLMEKGLLFEENGKYMNFIYLEKPKFMEGFTKHRL